MQLDCNLTDFCRNNRIRGRSESQDHRIFEKGNDRTVDEQDGSFHYAPRRVAKHKESTITGELDEIIMSYTEDTDLEADYMLLRHVGDGRLYFTLDFQIWRRNGAQGINAAGYGPEYEIIRFVHTHTAFFGPYGGANRRLGRMAPSDEDDVQVKRMREMGFRPAAIIHMRVLDRNGGVSWSSFSY